MLPLSPLLARRLAKARKDEVMEWVKLPHPDEISEGWGQAGKPPAAPEPQDGMTVCNLWWD